MRPPRSHEEQHRYRKHRIGPRGEKRKTARLVLFLVGGRFHAENLLLIRPDQRPDIDQHDRSQPGAYPDSRHSSPQPKRIDELVAEQCGAGKPGNDSSPAKEKKRPRGDVLADAGSGAVSRRRFHGGDLHKIKVIQEADPHDAGHEMDPTGECGDVIHVHAPAEARMVLTTKYSIAVRITPEITVPQSESSGFFIIVLLWAMTTRGCGAEAFAETSALRNCRGHCSKHGRIRETLIRGCQCSAEGGRSCEEAPRAVVQFATPIPCSSYEPLRTTSWPDHFSSPRFPMPTTRSPPSYRRKPSRPTTASITRPMSRPSTNSSPAPSSRGKLSKR